jgi:hypothetical protein
MTAKPYEQMTDEELIDEFDILLTNYREEQKDFVLLEKNRTDKLKIKAELLSRLSSLRHENERFREALDRFINKLRLR